LTLQDGESPVTVEEGTWAVGGRLYFFKRKRSGVGNSDRKVFRMSAKSLLRLGLLKAGTGPKELKKGVCL